MNGRVVHFELPADDVNRAQDFYREAFGWQITPIQELDYTMVTTTPTDEKGMPAEPGAINGGMMQRIPGFNGAVITIEADDIDEMLRRVESLGGKTIMSRQPVGEMGFTAYFTDTEGNVIGLWQNAS